MAKSVKPKKDATSKTPVGVFAHLAKVAAAKAARGLRSTISTHPVIAILFLVASALALPLLWAVKATAIGLKLGMLYQYADNGAKSGRANGNVYMRNGRIRKMTVPALVQNGYTTPVRSLLSTLSSSWNSLTDEQRLTWVNSDSYSRTNRFGITFRLAGKQLYVALNANLVNIGATPLDEAPLPVDISGITDLTTEANVTTSAFNLIFAPSPTEADVVHLVYCTATKSAGTFRPGNSDFRLIGLIDGAETTPFDAFALYTAKFGTPVANGKIFTKLIPIVDTTGQAGAAIVASCIVAA